MFVWLVVGVLGSVWVACCGRFGQCLCGLLWKVWAVFVWLVVGGLGSDCVACCGWFGQCLCSLLWLVWAVFVWLVVAGLGLCLFGIVLNLEVLDSA